MNYIWLVLLRALEHEDDFVRLLCFSVQSLRRTSGSWWWAWYASERRVWFRVWGWRADFRRSREKEESDKTRSKKSSQGYFWELVALFSTLQVFSYQWLFPCLFLGDAKTIPGVSGNEDVSTGVETDGQLRGRHIVVTRSLVPLAGGSQHDVPEAVHSRGRSRELLERAFDDGNSCAQMRNLLVLLQVGSKFYHVCFFCRSVRDRSRCHCESCHWLSDGVLVSLR